MTTTDRALPKHRPNPMPPTDKSVVLDAIHAAGAAGRRARAAMYGTYYPHLLGALRRKGIDAKGAEDRTQEFFARLFDRTDRLGRSLSEFQLGTGSFGGWLKIVSWHACLNWMRAEHKDAIGDGARCVSVDCHEATRVEVETLAQQSLDDECAKVLIVRRAYEKLRREYSTVHEVSFVDDLYHYLSGEGRSFTVAYFTEAFGIGDNAVSQRRRRVKGRLRELLVSEALEFFRTSDCIEDELRRLAMLE